MIVQTKRKENKMSKVIRYGVSDIVVSDTVKLPKWIYVEDIYGKIVNSVEIYFIEEEEEEKEEKEEKMKDRYEIHFGLAYDKSAGGIDKRYHRVRKYDTFKGASRCLSRANRCKWIEWTDFVDKKEHLK